MSYRNGAVPNFRCSPCRTLRMQVPCTLSGPPQIGQTLLSWLKIFVFFPLWVISKCAMLIMICERKQRFTLVIENVAIIFNNYDLSSSCSVYYQNTIIAHPLKKNIAKLAELPGCFDKSLRLFVNSELGFFRTSRGGANRWQQRHPRRWPPDASCSCISCCPTARRQRGADGRRPA